MHTGICDGRNIKKLSSLTKNKIIYVCSTIFGLKLVRKTGVEVHVTNNSRMVDGRYYNYHKKWSLLTVNSSFLLMESAACFNALMTDV